MIGFCSQPVSSDNSEMFYKTCETWFTDRVNYSLPDNCIRWCLYRLRIVFAERYDECYRSRPSRAIF